MGPLSISEVIIITVIGAIVIAGTISFLKSFFRKS
jgi:hypothetical protein